jgi:hypothetical protein
LSAHVLTTNDGRTECRNTSHRFPRVSATLLSYDPRRAAARRAASRAPRPRAHAARRAPARGAMAAPFGLASFVHSGVAALGAALTLSASAHAAPPARADGCDAARDASSDGGAHAWALEDVRWAPEAMVRRPVQSHTHGGGSGGGGGLLASWPRTRALRRARSGAARPVVAARRGGAALGPGGTRRRGGRGCGRRALRASLPAAGGARRGASVARPCAASPSGRAAPHTRADARHAAPAARAQAAVASDAAAHADAPLLPPLLFTPATPRAAAAPRAAARASRPAAAAAQRACAAGGCELLGAPAAPEDDSARCVVGSFAQRRL